VLFDGLLHLWEALSLVVLYLCYVAIVVAGSIWQKRRGRKVLLPNLAPSVYEGEPLPEIFVDDEPYRDTRMFGTVMTNRVSRSCDFCL